MLQVRDAVPPDRPNLVAFMAALNLVEHQWQGDRALDRASADQHLATLEGLVREQTGFLLVAACDARLLGFLIGIVEQEVGTYVVPDARRYGYITDLFVSDSSRGRGIGRALMKEAELRFKTLGLATVRVTALAANETAGSSYRALGYQALEVTYSKSLA